MSKPLKRGFKYSNNVRVSLEQMLVKRYLIHKMMEESKTQAHIINVVDLTRLPQIATQILTIFEPQKVGSNSIITIGVNI